MSAPTPETPAPAEQPVTPRPAATVMLLRDRARPHPDLPPLQVLLLRRSGDTPFVPGAHVFPGGAVEDDDADGIADHVDGLDDDAASRALGVPGGGLAWWAAAVRELLEEAGVLLAHGPDGRPVRPDHPVLADIDRLRVDVETGRRHLAALCAEHDLRLPFGDVVYLSRWITPAWSPRRYDARFFVAATPPGQRASSDGWEAVDAAWWEPTAALADWQAGRIDLIEPTVANLELLARHATAADALAGLRALVAARGVQGGEG